jgi:hypothetical protein
MMNPFVPRSMNLDFGIPENLPLPKTPDGIAVTAILTLVLTLVLYKGTRAKLAWIPSLVIGLLAGSMVS